MVLFDSTALGSDVPRNRAQAWRRRAARAVIGLLRLDRPTPFATEFCQALDPIAVLDTPSGPLRFRAGHGRLVWRVDSFYAEEPQTVAWLEAMGPGDVLWDVGANVGMYSLYAAKTRGVRVFAFEPEAQNFALLVDNIVLNDLGGLVVPSDVAIADRAGFGRLAVRYVTKGGAYNHYQPGGQSGALPYAPSAADTGPVTPVSQMLYGTTLSALLDAPDMVAPTHLKIDVDGLEPDIIDGAGALLSAPRLRTVLIELNRNVARDMAVPDILADHGFRQVAARSNWEYRADRSREDDVPTVNMIFERKPQSEAP